MKLINYTIWVVMMTCVYKCDIAQGLALRVIALMDISAGTEDYVESYVAGVNTFLRGHILSLPERNISLAIETFGNVTDVDDLLLRIGNTSNVLALTTEPGHSPLLKNEWLTRPSTQEIPLLDIYPTVDKISKYPSLVSVTLPVDDVTSVLVQLLVHLRWSYVQAVYQNSPYFSTILEHVHTVAGRSNICVLKSFPISDDVTTTMLLNTMQSLGKEHNTSGVLILMDKVLTRRFTEVIKTHRSSELFHFLTVGNWDDTSVSPILGTLAINREWTHTRLSVRSDIPETNSLETALQFLLHGLDMALPDILSCQTGLVSDNPMGCIRQSLLDALRKDNDGIYVYNFQGNASRSAWIKTIAVMNNTNKIISPVVFYDNDDVPIEGDVVSISQPFRWECRNNIVQEIHMSEHADVYLVGVFPMHERADTPNGCGDINPDQVILAEAVAYGVDIINNDIGTLPSLSIGYVIIDSCSLADRTIAQLDQIFSGKAGNGINLQVVSQIFGAVGFTGHDEYAPLAGYLHSKDILAISATAIDSDFSKKEVYPDFMRMVPDQREEISVMFQTLKIFGVKYIGIVYSEEHLNDESSNLLIDTADSLNISVIYAMRITKGMGQNDISMDNLVDEFIERNLNSTRVLVTFAVAGELLPLFKAMKRRHVEQVMWVGDNSWFTTVRDNEMMPYTNLLDLAFVVGIPTHTVPAFIRHFIQIQNNNSASSEYTRELLNLMETCNNRTNNDICNKLHSDMFSHNDAYLVIDSVKALAEGLEDLLQTCPLGNFCQDAKKDLASHLRESIFQNHFLGSSGKIVRFDSKGNGPASFGIYQVVPDKEHIKYQKIGSFEDGSLSVSSNLSIPMDMKKSECSINTCAHVPPDIFGKPYIYIDGNPMLYGFVKIYERKDEASCSGEVSRNGYQAMETMVWGVNAINNNTSLLPNLTLGLAVFPTCGISTNTKNIVQSVLLPNLVLSSRGLPPNTTILGIVGGETVVDAIAMETATRTLDTEIPVIISSRADVNDGRPHPRLFRTAPSPFAEMDYILELCLQLKWTYIHIVYGQLLDSVVKYLADITDANGICIASRNMLDESASSDVTRSALINMTEVEGATVVILVTTQNAIKQVLKEARDLYLLGRLFFVLPFEMYNLKQDLSENDIGVLSSRQDIQINNEFMDYLSGLNIKDKANDPWFADFWQQANGCNLRFSSTYDTDCSNSEHLSTSKVPASPSTNGILDSVFSLGHALHDLIGECNTDVSECITGNLTHFYNNIDRFLIESDFTSPGGSPFKFRDKTSVSKPLIVTNVQKSPEGGVRLVDVGTFVNRKLTLDMRKLSFYRKGVRVIPESKCLGDCRNCLDPSFVNEYDARVTSLLSAGPIFEHKIFTSLGVIDIVLVCISFMFIGIAVYFLCKFHTHKVFNLCLDADTGILIGCVLMTCSSCCYLFTQTKLMCTVQLGSPALSYAICIASLVVKINKAACLRSYLGFQQCNVPKWDFALTYIPLLLVPTIIVFFKWMKSDAVNIDSIVPDIREISSIDEVTISWRCSFDREFYSVYMTTFWFVIVQVIIITFSYILRCNKEPEVKQVMWSSAISLVFIAGSTLVLMLTGNVEIYGIVMCIVLNLNSMVLTCANFLPAVFILMNEEQREQEFGHILTQDTVAHMAKFWRDNKSRKKESKGNVARKYANSLWKQGAELSVYKSATSIEEGT